MRSLDVAVSGGYNVGVVFGGGGVQKEEDAIWQRYWLAARKALKVCSSGSIKESSRPASYPSCAAASTMKSPAPEESARAQPVGVVSPKTVEGRPLRKW